ALGLVAGALAATYWHLQDYAILVGAAWLFARGQRPGWQLVWLAAVALAAAALVSGLAILWLSRDFNFYFDEWSFIFSAPDWQLISYFQPHNEHPSMLPRLIYAVLLNTVGLRSYVPYMAVLLVLHGVNVCLLFELVRRRGGGDVVGLAAAASL